MNCSFISRNYLKAINKMLHLIKVKDVLQGTARLKKS